jgi:hypothetical protein
MCHDHDPVSADTGTVMRRSLLTEYAISAQFGEVEILPIEDFSLFRFYWFRCPPGSIVTGLRSADEVAVIGVPLEP